METRRLRIFVAGTGFTGGRILQELRSRGHEVTGMNRRGTEGDLPVVAGDVLHPDGLRALEALEPFDLLISTLSGSSLRDPMAYRSLYVDGPRRVAEALGWRGVPRVWVLGSTGVYGEAGGEWVDESTPARPSHRKGEVQLEAERAVAAAFDDHLVLRLSGLYGPGRTRLVRQALRKRPYFKPDVWSNQVHGDDVAGVVGQLVERSVPSPKLLLVSDDRPTRRREIFAWVRARTGAEEGWYDEDHPHVRGAGRGDKRVSNRRLRDLGIALQYPSFRDGLDDLLPESP